MHLRRCVIVGAYGRCARGTARSTQSRSMRSRRFLRRFSRTIQRTSGSSLRADARRAACPPRAGRRPRRSRRSRGSFAACGSRRRGDRPDGELGRHTVEQREHLADAGRLPEQPGSQSAATAARRSRRSTSPASHVRAARRSRRRRNVERDRDGLPNRQPGSAASRRRSAALQRPPSKQPPETDDTADGQKLPRASERSVVGPERGPPPQRRLVGLLGGRRGELEVPRGPGSRVVEQERLPVGELGSAAGTPPPCPFRSKLQGPRQTILRIQRTTVPASGETPMR